MNSENETPATAGESAGSIKRQKRPVLGCYVAAALVACVLPVTAEAEIISDSYRCELGPQSREITLVYLEQPGQVPCEIRELKNNDLLNTLWRAENDSSFCRRQFTRYRSKLVRNGWPCAFGEPSEPSLTPSEPDLEPSIPAVSLFIESSVTTPALTVAAIPGARTVDKQVQLYENQPGFQIAYPSPIPPGGKNSRLTAEDIREMDDWLIYLSAQTMASIRSLAPNPETFEEYQQQELLNSSNIYERLQARIEFLKRLLAERKTKHSQVTVTDLQSADL